MSVGFINVRSVSSVPRVDLVEEFDKHTFEKYAETSHRMESDHIPPRSVLVPGQ